MIFRTMRRAMGILKRRVSPKFHNRSYLERTRIIKEIYSHKRMFASFERYFGSLPQTRAPLPPRSPFYDIIVSYARTLKPESIHQIGCFTAIESRWLIESGFSGNVIASDFDPERLDYLKQMFSGTRYEPIHFRVLDLESRDYENLRGCEMIVAYAVFSNLQPETVDYFISRMEANGISIVIIQDIIVKGSLLRSTDNISSVSIPSSTDNNWYHKYLAIASKYSIDTFILPEFIATAQTHSGCIFVLHRRIPMSDHYAAIGDAFKSYVSRQDHMLKVLEEADR
jgi:hypothetical protein